MAGIQLSGLASGMDWKSTVEQLMRLERMPQDRLKARQAQSSDKQAALDKIKAAVTTLQTAASGLDLGSLTSGPRTAKLTSSLALKSTAIPVAFEGTVTGDKIMPTTQAGTALASGLFGPVSGVYYTVSGEGIAPGTIVSVQYDAQNGGITIDPPATTNGTVWLTFNYSGSGYETSTVPVSDPGIVTAEDGATTGSYEVRVLQAATEAVVFGANNGLVPDWDSATDSAGDGLRYDALKLSDYGVNENDTVTVNGTQYKITAADLNLSAKDFLVARGGTVVTTNSSFRDKDGKLDISFSNSPYVPFLGNSSDSGDVLEKLGISFSAMDGVNAVYQQNPPADALLQLKLSSFGASAGYIKINGKQVSYSSSDTLGSLISSVNDSDSGVTAELDADRRRLVFRATAVGGGRISLDDNGGVLDKLGVNASSQLDVTAQSGWNPRDGDSPYVTTDRNTYYKTGSPMTYTLIRNGKPVGSPGNSTTLVDGTTVGTFTAPGNTVDLSVHGFGKTKLSVTQAGTYKFQVTGVENNGRDKFDALIKAYNDLRSQVQDVTKITVGADGKVTTSVLSGNRDLVTLLSTVRSRLFSAVEDPGSIYSNFSSSYDRLERLGIAFDRNGVLSVTSSAKLTEALRDYPTRVNALFNSGASSITASGTSGNTYITTSNLSNLAVGQALTGTGIPAGARIGSIDSANSRVNLVDGSNASVSLTSSFSSSSVYLPVENQGLSVRLNGLISKLLDTSTSTPGLFASGTASIANEKKTLQRQIDLMDRQLAARQAALEKSFIAMEQAQSRSQSMLSQLNSAFQKSSS